MRNIDKTYKKYLEEVLYYGKCNEVRAKWSDGVNAKTVSISQVFFKEDNPQNDFPITNFRKINYKKAINEILWIFQKRSNKLKDLNSMIWNSWEYKNTGSIGHTYGFIANKEYKSMINKYLDVFGNKKYLNQVEYLFQTIIDNPYDRRMMINLYDLNEIQESNLPPCAFMTSYTIIDNKLNMHLTQRSGDMLVASLFGGWNTVQYAFLHQLIAKCCGLDVGSFSHFVMNSHIYDKHWKDNNLFDYVEQSLDNEPVKLEINIENNINNNMTKTEKLKVAWDNFLNFKESDYNLIGYNPNNYKLKLEVAI
jgi:thymidylate synthase